MDKRIVKVKLPLVPVDTHVPVLSEVPQVVRAGGAPAARLHPICITQRPPAAALAGAEPFPACYAGVALSSSSAGTAHPWG